MKKERGSNIETADERTKKIKRKKNEIKVINSIDLMKKICLKSNSFDSFDFFKSFELFFFLFFKAS